MLIFSQAPSEPERFEILNALLWDSVLAPDVSLSTLATQTAALVASDRVGFVERARLISIERIMAAMYSSSPITYLGYLTVVKQSPEPKQGTTKC